jgi:hypothetical protein
MFKMAGFKPFMTENQPTTVVQQEITDYSAIIRWDIICIFWYT